MSCRIDPEHRDRGMARDHRHRLGMIPEKLMIA